MLLPNEGIKLGDIITITEENNVYKGYMFLVKKIYAHSDKDLIAYDIQGLDKDAIFNVLGKSIVKVKSDYKQSDIVIVTSINKDYTYLKQGQSLSIYDIYNGYVGVTISGSRLKIPITLIEPIESVFKLGDTVKIIYNDGLGKALSGTGYAIKNHTHLKIGQTFIIQDISGEYLRYKKGEKGIHYSLCQKISLDIDTIDKPSIKVKTKFNLGDFVHVYDKKFPYVVLAKGYGENYRLQDPSSKEIVYAHADHMTLIDIPKVSMTSIQKGDQIVINNKSKRDSFFHKYYGRKFEVERFDRNGIYVTIGGAETFIPVAYVNKIESIVETSEPILNTNINNQMSTTLDKITIEKFYSNDKNIEAVTITKEELADYKKDLTFLVNIFSKYKSKVSEMEYDFNEAIASDNIKEIKTLIKTIGTRLDSLDSIISETIITDLLPVEEVTIETKEESVKFWNN